MRNTVIVFLVALSGCGGAEYIRTEPSDVGITVALAHTVFLDELGCTGVDTGGGRVYTAAHCVDDLKPGAETAHGQLTFTSPTLDFAYLYDKARSGNAFACLRAPRLGEHLYTVGYPTNVLTGEQQLNITDGVFAGQYNPESGEYRITAPIYFGNSGGGAWAEDGCLVGLTVSLVRSVEGSGWIVPADEL